ncbi:hypothetical protein ACFQMA_16470 [Halosimplex aquaticum]|uniref:Uncharacterized protein n=1 Tax=Halosimplex aquaticum TaxID=3026162 RepID=A0ABD5Y227_9EURY|nr:hypothetical protein [Halosimplex aquaticum]
MLSNAVQSFRYAFRRELLALYAAVVVGQWIMDLSNVVLAVVPFLPRFVRRVLSWPIFLLGLALVVGGVVGVLHRVVSDAG